MPDYAGVSGSVAVSVDDSDTAGLVLSESSLDIGEDGSGSFTVKLVSRPSADVSVSFASGDAAAVSVTVGFVDVHLVDVESGPDRHGSRVSPMTMRPTRPCR